MFEDVSNVKIGITKFSDSVVYEVNCNDKKQEVLFLCEKHIELTDNWHTVVIDGVLHRTLVFKATVFIKLFKDYSGFRALRKTLDLSKYEDEIDDTEFIYVWIRDPFEKNNTDDEVLKCLNKM